MTPEKVAHIIEFFILGFVPTCIGWWLRGIYKSKGKHSVDYEGGPVYYV